MSDPREGSERAKGPVLVSIPQMPDHLEEAGLKRLTPARIRQLRQVDAAFPSPVYERGRVRLYDLTDALEYFRERVPRQGERTDLNAEQPQAE